MDDYVYKGFKIVYNIEAAKDNKNLYKADGYVECLLGEQNGTLPCKFHTELNTYEGVRQEIKKMVENYIDFEWKEFNKMKT